MCGDNSVIKGMRHELYEFCINFNLTCSQRTDLLDQTPVTVMPLTFSSDGMSLLRTDAIPSRTRQTRDTLTPISIS